MDTNYFSLTGLQQEVADKLVAVHRLGDNRYGRQTRGRRAACENARKLLVKRGYSIESTREIVAQAVEMAQLEIIAGE